MPKFLDAPSWYDDDGNLKTIQGDLTIYVGSGYNITFDVPHVGGTNIDRFGGLGTVSSEYYLLPAASAPGRIPYYVNTNVGYQTLPSGTSGQVLTSNGNAAPSWKNLSLTKTNLYCHNVRMLYSVSTTTYYNIIFSFFAERSTPYTTSSFSSMRNDIYSRYGVVGEGCYILAAGSAQGVDSVSILEVTTSSFFARRMPIGGDEYAITNASALYDKCFAVLSSASLNT